MADHDVSAKLDALERQIAELHATLTKHAGKSVSISPADIQIYNKVQGALISATADWGDFCGINDCYRGPLTFCLVCIVECNRINAGIAQVARFNQF